MNLSLLIGKARPPRLASGTVSKTLAEPFRSAGLQAEQKISTLLRLFLLTLAWYVPFALQAQAPNPEAASATSPSTQAQAPATDNTPSDITSSNKRALPSSKPSSSYPKWSELNNKQKLALLPLLDLWPEMSETQKRKWLSLSANFTDLSVSDQEKLQTRMTQWSLLSPQQRVQARVIFAQVQQFQGDERLNKWQEYQALDPAQRNELAQNLNIMPNSAAISPKPKAIGASMTTLYKPAHEPSHLRLQVDQIASKTLLPPKRNSPAP
jgi:hypothetical protein